MKILLLLLTCCTGLLNSRAGEHSELKDPMPYYPEKADPIEQFWNWFRENQKKLRNFEENPDDYLHELLTEARKIKPGLAIELEPPKSGVINMTVSANGNTELFDLVEKTIAKAPEIEGWKFTAFRQRLSREQIKGMKLTANGFELDPGAMMFHPVISGDQLDIIIYVKGVTDKNYNQVAYGGLLILDNILGEYDCVTKVNSYDFHEMPETKEEQQGLLPLLDIVSFVDGFHNSKTKTKQPAIK